MAEITTEHLTEATLSGGGVFDELMRAAKAHLQEEYSKGRIKGPEYATVYLGAMTQVMQQSITFLLEKQRADAQAELLKAQVITEAKQQALLDVQVEKTHKEIAHLDAQIALTGQQRTNLTAEKLRIDAQTALIQQQRLNAVKENEVLDKQICKLQAEFDVLMETKLKTVAETTLLGQKTVTERAQTQSTGVVADSVIGRQKALHQAQATGLVRDAEQKAAKVLVDTWTVRRTTDEGTQANTQNQLSDAHVGRAIGKLLSGVGA